MRSPLYAARRYWSLILSGAFIMASLSGCTQESKRTVLDPRGQPSGIFGRVGEAGAGMMANRNPDTQPKLSRDELAPLRMAPRLENLDGKTIYLVDVGFAGGREFLEELQNWFRENMPSVKTTVIMKSGNTFVDSPELWPELKEKADGVIFGVGG